MQILLQIIINLIFGSASAIGFSLITNAPRRAAGVIGLSGGLSWAVFWTLKNVLNVHYLLANVVGALTIGMLSYYFSRKIHLPENIIYIPCLVNLVPGGNAYRTVLYMVQNKFIDSVEQAITTFLIASFIAVGLFGSQYLIAIIKKIITFRKINNRI